MRRSQQALTLAQESVHPYSLAYAQFWAAYLHHRRRDVLAVQAQAGALLALVQLGGKMYSVLSAEARGKTTHSPAPNWRGICGTQY